MSVAVALLGYAVLLAAAGPVLLRWGGWVDRAPRLGVAAWQALTASVVLAVAFGGLALAVPTLRLSAGLAELLQACVFSLRAAYATPGGAAVASTAGVLAVSVVTRCAYCLVAELVAAGRARRRHREALSLVGRLDSRLGAVIVDHEVPTAYCLPGRHRQVVLTSAALAALGEDQLRAVFAHEQAHLRGRHDLVKAGAMALQRAFPRVPLFRVARGEIDRLVELLADDAATRAAPRLTVAEAMLTLAQAGSPAGALAAGGSTAAQRVRRLIASPQPLGRLKGELERARGRSHGPGGVLDHVDMVDALETERETVGADLLNEFGMVGIETHGVSEDEDAALSQCGVDDLTNPLVNSPR